MMFGSGWKVTRKRNFRDRSDNMRNILSFYDSTPTYVTDTFTPNKKVPKILEQEISILEEHVSSFAATEA